jgi:hypothetical protein
MIGKGEADIITICGDKAEVRNELVCCATPVPQGGKVSWYVLRRGKKCKTLMVDACKSYMAMTNC